MSTGLIFGRKEFRSPLCTSSIRTDNNRISPVRNLAFDIPQHDRLGKEVVDRDSKEALRLRGVQIDSDDMIAPGDLQHVCNELRSDWRS